MEPTIQVGLSLDPSLRFRNSKFPEFVRGSPLRRQKEKPFSYLPTSYPYFSSRLDSAVWHTLTWVRGCRTSIATRRLSVRAIGWRAPVKRRGTEYVLFFRHHLLLRHALIPKAAFAFLMSFLSHVCVIPGGRAAEIMWLREKSSARQGIRWR